MAMLCQLHGLGQENQLTRDTMSRCFQQALSALAFDGVDMDNLLTQLLLEEQELQFNQFTEDDAWQLGSHLVKRAIADHLPVTIDITRGDHQIFHASRPGTSPDNDEWIKRKIRLVYRFGHSSYYIGQLLKSKGKSLEEAYLISEVQFAPHGGAFPILIKGVGLVGTVTVSGLPQEEDHRLVTNAIREFLNHAD
jgi:uncharacterized protein (UPF0303 family)